MFLLMELLVQFLFNEAFPFLFPENRLLLLFIVEQSIEFLNSCPLVVLIQLGVDLSFGYLGRSHT